VRIHDEAALARKVATLVRLRDLNVGASSVTGTELFPALPPSLERLDVQLLRRADEGALARRMARLGNLRRLNLRYSSMTGTELFRALPDGLEELDVSGLEGLDENQLAGGLYRWSKLRALDVGATGFRDAFAALPESLETLGLWGLDHGQLLDDGALALRLPELRRLEALDLRRTPYRGRHVYPAIPSSLRRLNANVGNAELADDRARGELARRLPELRIE
jgi:hypothetical protein